MNNTDKTIVVIVISIASLLIAQVIKFFILASLIKRIICVILNWWCHRHVQVASLTTSIGLFFQPIGVGAIL